MCQRNSGYSFDETMTYRLKNIDFNVLSSSFFSFLGVSPHPSIPLHNNSKPSLWSSSFPPLWLLLLYILVPLCAHLNVLISATSSSSSSIFVHTVIWKSYILEDFFKLHCSKNKPVWYKDAAGSTVSELQFKRLDDNDGPVWTSGQPQKMIIRSKELGEHIRLWGQTEGLVCSGT